MCHDNKETEGRPHTDEILIIKRLVLAGWYGISDYELELLAKDRLSFWHFLGYPDKIPERSTIWKFREDLAKNGIHLIWENLQHPLEEKGFTIKHGTIQDASIITSDPGHTVSSTPRRDNVKT